MSRNKYITNITSALIYTAVIAKAEAKAEAEAEPEAEAEAEAN